MKRALFVVALLLLARPAAAQESGQVGLSVGFPGSIGITWHVSDGIAIRPDFSFSHTHSESSTSTVTSDSWSAGFGTSALFYTGKINDHVRTYLAPRFSYSRTNSSSQLSGSGSNPVQHQNSYQYSGSFGVQYTASRRFSVYGEAGVLYQTSEAFFSTTSFGISIEGKSTNDTWGSRAGVGIVWYFK